MKRLFLKALYLFVVTAILCGCEFIPSIENGGSEQETPGKEFKILVSDFGDFDEFAYNENTFVIYNHNDKGLPEWMFTYTYDEPTDAEHYEYVIFDDRGIPEYYNIDNESIYIDNVRGNLVDMIVIAEDGSFSVVPDMDTGVNLETFWSEKGELTRAGDGGAGMLTAQEVSNLAKGGKLATQGSVEFWRGSLMMLVGCCVPLIPGMNVVAGATLVIAGGFQFLQGAMHLTMATDLMHSDGTHTEYLEPTANGMEVVGTAIGLVTDPVGTGLELGVDKFLENKVSELFDKRASEVVTYEKAVEAVMLSLHTASYDVDIATESVTLYGSIDGEIGAGDYVGLYVSDEPTAMHVLVASKATIGSNGSFQIICDGLEMGHTYYYKSYYYSATQDRTYIANTREFVLPGVVTGDYEKVGEGQYRVKLEALLDEDMLNPTVGICWSTNNSTPTTDDSCSTATIIESGAYGAVIEPSKLPCYYRAFIEVDGEAIYGDVRKIAADERDILIKFYHDTGGDNWTHNDNWCSDKPIEEWYGILVSDGYYDENRSWVEERGVELYLHKNNLQGSGSLAGMETLYGLHCYNNQLTSLDCSGCTALEHLCCYNNQQTSLDCSGCTALEELYCHNNQLTSLNCSGCTALEDLYCYNNQLTSLDVSGCTALEHLCCEDNQLTTLDVSGCTALEDLYCHNNQLTSLDCSGCTALEELYCSINQLTTLDVSGCTALVELYCCNTQLTTLDVSGCTALYWLICCNNQLTTLDVSGCTALYRLECYDNQLTSLNCSGFTVLEDLICHNNQLTTLDVSGCTALYGLGCSNNQLTSLDVSGCTALHWLNCEKNQLTQEITGIFAQIPDFWHDVRYEYWDEWVDGVRVRRYKDRGVGWWYPGEPQKGYHGK